MHTVLRVIRRRAGRRRTTQLTELLPVVEYSTRRRLAGGGGTYWDYATMLEAALYRDDLPGALDWLAKALVADPAPMEAESTLVTIQRIRKAHKGNCEQWDVLVHELARLAHLPDEPGAHADSS